MQVGRIYTGDDNQTHFQDLPDLFECIGPTEMVSGQLATGIVLGLYTHTFFDWHNVPQRRYVIILSGELEIEIGDGSKRRFSAGDMLLEEDTSGQGHITRGFGERRLVTISLP